MASRLCFLRTAGARPGPAPHHSSSPAAGGTGPKLQRGRNGSSGLLPARGGWVWRPPTPTRAGQGCLLKVAGLHACAHTALGWVGAARRLGMVSCGGTPSDADLCTGWGGASIPACDQNEALLSFSTRPGTCTGSRSGSWVMKRAAPSHGGTAWRSSLPPLHAAPVDPTTLGCASSAITPTTTTTTTTTATATTTAITTATARPHAYISRTHIVLAGSWPLHIYQCQPRYVGGQLFFVRPRYGSQFHFNAPVADTAVLPSSIWGASFAARVHGREWDPHPWSRPQEQWLP
jgi:hypothetical protein